MKALKLSEGPWGLERFFDRRCLVEPAYSRTIAEARQASFEMPPVKVMDHLYFLGRNDVSSWALDTSAGFIIFDTLNSPEQARDDIAGGLRKLGLDPTRIKYVVITHEHGDHFSGAKYLKETFGARLMASKIAWANMASVASAPPPPPGSAPHSGPPPEWAKLVPPHDIDIADGQKITIGDTTLNFYLTPGHAEGVISTIFKTTDHGVPHVLAIHGGLGGLRSAEARVTHITQLRRFRAIAEAAGVDTLIGNHQTQDGAVESLELVKIRTGNDPNPFVLGKQGYLRYLDINIECTLASIARNGEKMP